MSTKRTKMWVATLYLLHLEHKGILDLSQWELYQVHEYIASLEHYTARTKQSFVSVLREMFDWLHNERLIRFSGHQAFPRIRNPQENRILSYYTQDEIDKMIACIDISKPCGRRDMLVVCLAAVLGLRAGDIISLKFGDIDWNNNTINIIQKKTGRQLTLPLVDAVKFPLIDYLKNGRHESKDNDYILVTVRAPYTKNHSTALARIITKYMNIAGINIDGRHHGPHALRHSLATNLMRNNVPLSAISNVLGHASTRTTEYYLTVDEKNLEQLSLEVPDEK